MISRCIFITCGSVSRVDVRDDDADLQQVKSKANNK